MIHKLAFLNVHDKSTLFILVGHSTGGRIMPTALYRGCPKVLHNVLVMLKKLDLTKGK